MATERCYWCKEMVPFTAMMTVECTNAGLSTIYKAAVTKGLSYHVFMFYSYAISALLLLPLSFLFHRKASLPPFTILLVGKFLILGILGFTSQYVGYKGIAYSNPTMGSAMSNLTPATTFFLAILFRMEKLRMKSKSSQAKIMGTLVTIGGALVVVLYKGPMLITTTIINIIPNQQKLSISDFSSVNNVIGSECSESDWIKGGGLLAASYIIVSIWYIFQAKFVNEYPAEFVVVFFYYISACIVSLPVGIISEPNLSQWKVPFDIRLFSILYSGIIGSAFGTMVHTWGLHVKGPVYVALFKPLSIAIAAIFGVIFLGDNLYLGSVIGSAVISMGFYIVVWGKTKEELSEILVHYNHVAESSSCDVEAPLLKHFDDSVEN